MNTLNHPPKYSKRAIVEGPWASKTTAYTLMGLGAVAYLNAQQTIGSALVLGGIIVYMQNEQLLPWQ